jgi:hypothetical protein
MWFQISVRHYYDGAKQLEAMRERAIGISGRDQYLDKKSRSRNYEKITSNLSWQSFQISPATSRYE